MNGPFPFIFEQRRVGTVCNKRERARHEKKGGKRRFAQAIPNDSHTFLFIPLNECDDKDFCLRIFGQPENKIIGTKTGAKIAPIVLPSTAMLTCFNRPKSKNTH